jgi:hypothetical protein
MPKYNIGQKVKVYDSRVWRKYGRDIGHNEHCWKDARIENIRENVLFICPPFEDYTYPLLYDVVFLYDSFLSKGHFESSIRLI